MNTSLTDKQKVFTGPNLDVLQAAAKELGVELTAGHDIKFAEDLFQKGIKPPGSEHGWSPLEQAYVSQLLDEVTKQGMIPNELRVYLVDRGMLPPDTEETVGSLLIREKKSAYDNLLEGIHTLTGIAKEQKL